ncbi:unnamed protein product [Phytomonas sp. Hart1]|nr:unnamed protein product [Phytomonas sp. Hart1]|eukprot:CCW69168.1 unnamed protein product [Phytomonas sp. isolate Hart1]
MYGEIGTHTSRQQTRPQSSPQQTQLPETSLDSSNISESRCTGLNKANSPGNVGSASSGVPAVVSARSADVDMTSNAAGIPICGAPVLGAVSLRYLSWYSAMIISQIFTREQWNAQKRALSQQERVNISSTRLDAYPAAFGQSVSKTHEVFTRKQQPTLLLSPQPSFVRPAEISIAINTTECTSMINTFEEYFFPHHLFRNSVVDPDGMYASASGVVPTQYEAPMPTSTRLCTENELREVFQGFLKLGQQCTREAFSPPSVDCPTNEDSPNDRPKEGRGGRAAVVDCPDQTVEQKASSACRAMRQFIFSLAFNCPCTPLKYAAKFLLADALANTSDYYTQRGIFFRNFRASTAPAHMLEVICFLSRLPVLPTSFSNATPPRRAGAGLQSHPSSKLPSLESATGSDLRVREDPIQADETGDNPQSEVFVWEYHPLQFRSSDKVIWFDAQLHTQRLDEWLRENRLGAQPDGSSYFVCAQTPCAMALPTIERVIMKDNGDTEEKELLERVLRRAVREITPCGGSDIRASSMRTSRRRRQGGGGIGGLDTASPKNGEGVGGSKEITLSEPSRTCREPLIDPGGGNNKEFQNIARQRQRQLLVTLNRSQILVPRPTSLLRNEILYTVFTETGDCPTYYHLLSLYPDLLRAHHASMRYVFFDDGPLALDERLMLAIMVASRHQCEYLVCRYAALLMHYPKSAELSVEAVKECSNDLRAELFRSNDALNESSSVCGSEQWLLYGPPPRLRVVQRFIALAAHTPWLLNEDDVRVILRNGWTVPEVFQLTAIISHVLSLSSFVQGLFVSTEPWTWSMLPSAMLCDLQCHAEKVGNCNFTSSDLASPFVNKSQKSNKIPPTYSSSCFPSATSDEERMFALRSFPDADAGIFTRYAGEPEIVSKQRIRSNYSNDSFHTLRRSQFSWQDVGTTSMEHYYPGAAALLNEEIESFTDVVRQLTETDCVGLKNPGFTPAYAFHSLQLYVINLLGFMLEDYPYNDINKVLHRSAKWYAQALTMRPEALTLEEVILWRLSSSQTGPGGGSGGAGAVNGPAPSRTREFAGVHPCISPAVLTSQRARLEADLLAAQGGQSTPPLELPPAWVRQDPSSGGELTVDNGPHRGDDTAGPVDPRRQDEENDKALTIGLGLQDERVLLLMATATMMARKEALLHLLLYPLCAVLSKM